MTLLTNGAGVFARYCISGITANRERCASLVDYSLGLAALLVPVLGYDRSAALAKLALKEHKTLREVLLAQNIMTEETLNQLFLPQNMLRTEMTPDGR